MRMKMIDADVLLKDVERLIKQYEDMMKACEMNKRYRLYLDMASEVEGMRLIKQVINQQLDMKEVDYETD